MPSFRTKRGRCHLDGGRLRLESSLRGQFRRYREGSTLLFVGMVVGLAAAVGWPLLELAAGDYRLVLLWGGGVVVVLGVARLVSHFRGFTSDDEIPLDAIVRVEAVEGTKGLTRPRFVVTYERGGETNRRYVMMPSLWLSYGEEAFEHAKTCFRDAGVPVET